MGNSNSFMLFTDGEISITNYDKESRQVALRMCMPCCLIQSISLTLVKFGIIDDYCVKTPITIWMPELTPDRFKTEFISQQPSLVRVANTHIRKKIEEVLKMFSEASEIIRITTDLVPMLPLGVYIEFQYRCKIDDMAQILLGLENVELIGVSEFRFILATVLARLLELVN